jgi:hypothetical protein
MVVSQSSLKYCIRDGTTKKTAITATHQSENHNNKGGIEGGRIEATDGRHQLNWCSENASKRIATRFGDHHRKNKK